MQIFEKYFEIIFEKLAECCILVFHFKIANNITNL